VDAFAKLVVFELQGQRYALRLAAVLRVFAVAEITPLPNAPAIVLGVINVRGRVVPVVDMNTRFGLSPREIELSDCLIVARTSRRPVALLVSAVSGVIDCSQAQIDAADSIVTHAQYVEGVVKLDDGLVLIHDLDTFLSPLEEQHLQQAMTAV
jgi:purine-binding chemotaxis protein CheW